MKTGSVLIALFCIFFSGGLHAQHRLSARIDSAGHTTYIVSNKPQQAPIKDLTTVTPPSPVDTFKVQPATTPYRPTSPADRLRLEKYKVEQHKNSTQVNQ